MCGICGKLDFDGKTINKEEIRQMTLSNFHRGPDDEGYYFSGNIGLGFRRLSIIDLNTGRQPISNEDGTLWIIFNGEIYNYRELRSDLINRGHKFKSQTDTETIIHLYEEYGENCVKKLRGMFAFAIWDEKKHKLFCARDRFGIKPFFYYHDNEQFIFGSEIKNIIRGTNISLEIDLEALDYFLTYGYTPIDRTVFKNIKKLEPSFTLAVQEGNLRFKRYWEIEYNPDFTKTENEWCELIKEKLLESVKLRMISDVPLGAFLSGGIDSSTVVGLMSKCSNQPIKTFSIGYSEPEFNELPYAKEFSELYGTEHYEKIVYSQSIDLLPSLIDTYDEPFADASAIPTYFVSKFARKHVTVALSGDGGDELFAGYDHYNIGHKVNQLKYLPAKLRMNFFKSIFGMIPDSVRGKGLAYYLAQPTSYLGSYISKTYEPERALLYKPDVWNEVNECLAETAKNKLLDSFTTEDVLFRMQQLDMRTYMVDDILTKVDRASMQNSLEVRVPFLDHEFANLCFTIPSDLKYNPFGRKYILKKAMADILPNSFLSRKKSGFGLPLKYWFQDDLNDYIHDRLLNNDSPINEFIDRKPLTKLINDHKTGSRDLNYKIWTLLVLNEWLMKFNAIKTEIKH